MRAPRPPANVPTTQQRQKPRHGVDGRSMAAFASLPSRFIARLEPIGFAVFPDPNGLLESELATGHRAELQLPTNSRGICHSNHTAFPQESHSPIRCKAAQNINPTPAIHKNRRESLPVRDAIIDFLPCMSARRFTAPWHPESQETSSTLSTRAAHSSAAERHAPRQFPCPTWVRPGYPMPA